MDQPSYVIQLMYISNPNYYFVLIKKIETRNRTNGISDLVFVTLIHRSSSVAVAAILSELKRCLSEISDEMLLFL